MRRCFLSRVVAGLSAIAAATLPAYVFLARPRLVRLGATEEEALGPMPGDDIVPDPLGSTTMATTIDAAPSAIWPWLVQMGCGRAGWYSWDRLDNAGVPSAEQVLPELLHLRVGDHLPCTPRAGQWVTVAAIEQDRALVLRYATDRPFHPVDPKADGRRWSDATWAFVLRERQDGTTRLVVRTRSWSRQRALGRVFEVLVAEPVHFLMQHRQLVNLKRRAEIPLLSPAEEVWARGA